jgi:hypothetical protein
MRLSRTDSLAAIALGCALLAAASILPAQDAPGPSEERRPYKLPPNLLEHFQSRYEEVDDFLISTLQETPDGPLGRLNVRGRMALRTRPEGATAEERARAAARGFIAEEAELFDIGDPAELEEISFQTREGGETTIHYERTLGGLRLPDTLIGVSVDPEGAIRRVEASLAPTPAGLYRAVGRKTLSRDEVARIIERDLSAAGAKVVLKLADDGRSATWRPPYVVWGATASVGRKPAWGYTIDAFTGRILSRTCSAMGVRFDKNSTPCD